MRILTRKLGIWLCVIGIVIFLLNFLTYTLWDIDIDILGAVIFVLGLVITIAGGNPTTTTFDETIAFVW